MASPLGLGAALKAAALAAVLAALLATAWHEVASEPLVEQAVQLEAARHAGEPEEAPLVSREAQRIGLAVALALYGLTWALAIGGVFALAQERLPGGSVARRAALLALGAGWAVALLPFLKYPSNPPGVGDPATLSLRQELYFGVMAAGALGLAVALVAWARLRRSLGRGAGLLATLGYAAFCLALALALPANPDPTPVPPDLLFAFRLRSALGLVAYWGAFALLFALLVRRASRAAATRAAGLRVSPSGSRLGTPP